MDVHELRIVDAGGEVQATLGCGADGRNALALEIPGDEGPTRFKLKYDRKEDLLIIRIRTAIGAQLTVVAQEDHIGVRLVSSEDEGLEVRPGLVILAKENVIVTKGGKLAVQLGEKGWRRLRVTTIDDS